MKSADFQGELTNGQIAVPQEIAEQVPPGAKVQVILQWPVAEDESDWRAVGRRQFEAAYAADDSIYEQLINDPSSR
jgi:hypothetical protein